MAVEKDKRPKVAITFLIVIMYRCEAQKIRRQKERWDKAMLPFNKWLKRNWKICKKMIEEIVNWYWFPEEKNKGDKAWHLIMWWIITLGILRVLRFI